ncbi:MAG TPA: Uma2 family endonuclease [Thermoanaerobaculia bacterium]|jgi:Uma2 family endonuclease|nr:Uma2 family endonuclease [Thermoanaerobaculia bacterium]
MEIGARSLKLTYEDYLYFPEDGKRHELIDGEHYVTPAPNLKHQTTVVNLASDLHDFVRPRGLGKVWVAPVDVLLSDHDVVQPDLVFLSRDRLDLAADGANVKGAPDLPVEVLSPATRRLDSITKRHLYEKYEVPEYWLVDPELEIIQVYRLSEGTYRREAELSAEGEDILTSPLFPGLEIPLTKIFE